MPARRRPFSITVRSWMIGLLWSGMASVASAQVGTPVPTVAYELNGGAAIEPADELDDATIQAIHQFGITMLAANAPGGPVIASFSQVPPFPEIGEGGEEQIGFFFPGVPSGNYWVLIVVGVTTSTSAPASAWVQLVIPQRCEGRPGPPVLSYSIDGSTVNFSVGGGPGCRWDRIEIEAGSAPGLADIARFTAPGPELAVPNVPPGTYYLRARAISAFGVSDGSIELPLTLPACNQLPQAPLNFTANVGPGNTVTFTWSNTVATGRTYYQLMAVAGPYEIAASVLLPPTQTSLTVPGVPSGTYGVALLAGGPCNGTYAGPALTVTVP